MLEDEDFEGGAEGDGHRLLDHPVCSHQYGPRDRQAERLRGLAIDAKLKPPALLDG
jgi:hypothetical protein